MASVVLDGVRVRKDGADVLRGVDLTVEDGALVALVGTTGSGKTTVLRTVAGLDRPVAGRVLIGGADVTGLPPDARDAALVFQRPAIYPNRTVRGNIAFPLEMRHQAVEEIRQRVGAEARALHIEALLAERPDRLSAGQQHAVQIARALVRQPAVLLLDEPFVTIDEVWSEQLRRELHLLRSGFGTTTLMAAAGAHDAMTADVVVVLEAGRVAQVGAPLDVYHSPRTAAAAFLTGDADVFEVTVERDAEGNGAWLRNPGFGVRTWRPAVADHVGRRLQLVVRPEWWQLDEQGAVRVTVDRVVFAGAGSSLACRAGDDRLTVALPDGATARAGETIALRLDRFALLDPRDGFAIAE